MSDKGITLEGLAAAVDTLRQELATWKALARKQDTLTAAQITATQSGATAAKIDQIAVNTAAIQALSAQVAGQISLEYVTTLPVTGEPFTLYLVPQGDGTAPNYCNEYLWINGDWELIGTTGSMANNGELVIQVNGVAVGTFTANQAANTAVNITVPTNTNQLVNGAQYVDAAALQTALALKQNNLNAAQLDAVNSGITAALVTQIGTNTTAIAGKQDALTTAQQAAVDSGATAAKIGQIATNAAAIVSLTSSKQDTLSTAQLAAVNSGITSAAVQQISTNTGAIATKAADSDVVHLAGAETISGAKTWTGTNKFENTINIINNGVTRGVIPSTNKNYIINLLDSDGNTVGMLFQQIRSGSGSYKFTLSLNNGTTDHRINFFGFTDGTSSLIPEASGLTDLGASSNKWKTLNGINPGALSLPNLSAGSRVDISANIVADSNHNIKFTPQIYGWVYIDFNVANATITSGTEMYAQAKDNNLTNTDFAINFIRPANSNHIFVWMPVWANKQIIIEVNFSGFSVGKAYIYPCLGNV